MPAKDSVIRNGIESASVRTTVRTFPILSDNAGERKFPAERMIVLMPKIIPSSPGSIGNSWVKKRLKNITIIPAPRPIAATVEVYLPMKSQLRTFFKAKLAATFEGVSVVICVISKMATTLGMRLSQSVNR